MNEQYLDKICPYCASKFNASDEIVVCSDCEMPHHKDCFVENRACTTFGCMGTINGITASSNEGVQTGAEISPEIGRGAEAAQMPDLYCTRCGARRREEDLFCSKCGNALSDAKNPPAYTQAPHVPSFNGEASANRAYQAPQAPHVPSFNWEGSANRAYNKEDDNDVEKDFESDMKDFIRINHSYYINVFHELEMKRTKKYWNWVAFFFPVYWLFYRKIYKIGGIVLSICMVCQFLGLFGSIISITTGVVTGLFGNHFYLSHVEDEVRYGRTLPDYEKAAYFEKNGGTSSGLVFAAIVINIVVACIVSVLSL